MTPNPGGETTNLEGGAKSEDLKVGTVHQLRYKTTVLQRTVKDTRMQRGRLVKKPAWYCLAMESPVSQVEGRCKVDDHVKDHESERAQKETTLERRDETD